ncbi:unnamed protein product [Phytophthora lilii]|uniref:Unnamed protein product n=1 Tax=Phytophthora lilii TaxID=2077276 RepID=A0A9W6U394_9STRA|nr:unnamed protein product [Phytophthora lilii]
MVAKREKQARISAEVQHKELQAAVADHAALIVDLNRIFNKKVCRRGIGDNLLTEHQLQAETNDWMLLEDYLGGLSAIYREASNSCIPMTLSSGGFNTVRKATGDIDYIDATILMRLSLEFESACDLMRNVVILPNRQLQLKMFTSAESAMNESAFKCQLICPRYGGKSVSMGMHFVGRLYIEEARL